MHHVPAAASQGNQEGPCSSVPELVGLLQRVQAQASHEHTVQGQAQPGRRPLGFI